MKYRYWLVLFLCAVLFGLFYKEAKKDAIDNLNNQKLFIARQAGNAVFAVVERRR